jgi:hypothetical protein
VQVVLVDDASNHTDITTLLPLYIKHRLPPKVRFQHFLLAFLLSFHSFMEYLLSNGW